MVTTTTENAAALAPMRRSQTLNSTQAEESLDEFLSLVHRLLADKAKP